MLLQFFLDNVIFWVLLIAAATGTIFAFRLLKRRAGRIAIAATAAVMIAVIVWLFLPVEERTGFTFYEGNNADQSLLCSVSAETNQRFALKNGDCPNDEIRSVVIRDVPQGTILRVYDNENGNLEDDWTELLVRRNIDRRVVGSFESSAADEELEVVYHHNNGLDGGISLVEIERVGGGRPNAAATVALYEGENATQNKVCEVKAQIGVEFSFKNHAECDNDEARSLVLNHVPAGVVIRLFDSESGDRSNDWVEVAVNETAARIQIDNLESDQERAEFTMAYRRNDGLNGKVSRIEIASGPPTATIDLYEGNNGQQNLVCSLPLSGTSAVNFENDSECDNDEARSLILRNARAGQSIRLYDDPQGKANDDWTEIYVQKSLGRVVVSSFERNVDNDDITVTYHRSNGLDGQVSRLVLGMEQPSAMIDLYEGNDGRQNLVCSIPFAVGLQVVLEDHPVCSNDEARSAILFNIPQGNAIRVYDEANGSMRDDWTSISPKASVQRLVVETFESTKDSPELSVVHLHTNGIDGKVSRIAFVSASDGILSFREGNNGEDDRVCDVLSEPKQIRFGNNCANDEARSLVLVNIKAGQTVEVFDEADCSPDDDYTRIDIKRFISYKVIGTFQSSWSDDDVKVTFHQHNGLDGKISCARIR